MSASLAILMVHQGAELYGSDRSFASALEALRERHPQAVIDVVLPEQGPLVELVRPYATRCLFNRRGILRKVELKARPWHTLSMLLAGWRAYRDMFASYDVCYVNTVVCVAAIAALRGRRGGAYVHVREIPSPGVRWVFKALLRFSGATVMYNSGATAAAFGLPGAVIYNGVGAPAYMSEPGYTGARELRIAIIGRINPWKGQQFVLEALQTVGRALPVQIRIIGDVFPGYEALLDALRAAAGACDQIVEIEGFTNHPEAHFAWADFVLVPSILPEPFGRVAIESFAAGRPVIASNAGGLQEIVTDGATGLLFAPGDAEDLVRVLQRAVALTPEQYGAMAEAARQTYERRFTVRSYMDAIAEHVSAPHVLQPVQPQPSPHSTGQS
ncbi:glycosyltransferase family 4 protein [Paraburkholderia sp. DD10]|uniref:Glycosyltransferase involved in cell wall bisynthesis n=2 Tax=Paraburkholderia terricola TaxID=169427 RepID=A0A1M6NMZ1_9BURK|nr:Glycosyltransferase involved in cell wall bisynthesis [Paraburkholderia sediminicola]SHJ97004.1 Glycosyltransferase involved in cell wall bisynthesis [Paraburkholderia terricola]